MDAASIARWHLAQIARDKCGLKREEEEAFIDFLYDKEESLRLDGPLEGQAKKAVEAFLKRAKK